MTVLVLTRKQYRLLRRRRIVEYVRPVIKHLVRKEGIIRLIRGLKTLEIPSLRRMLIRAAIEEYKLYLAFLRRNVTSVFVLARCAEKGIKF